MGKAMWYREVPDDQRFSFTVFPKPGSLFRAKMLGGQLQAMAELMTEMGDKGSMHFETFVADIKMHDDGAIRFDLAVLPRAPAEQPENET